MKDAHTKLSISTLYPYIEFFLINHMPTQLFFQWEKNQTNPISMMSRVGKGQQVLYNEVYKHSNAIK